MSDAAPTISVLIASYNTREMTLACIRSVYAETSGHFEIIVVDNASSDGSAAAIEKAFPGVQLIKSADNLGFARANNIAADRAAGSFILLLNPDTVVLDRAIDRLLAFAAEHADAGIWGGRTVFPDGTLNPKSCWRFMSLWSLFAHAVGLTALLRETEAFNPEGYGGWQRDCVREIDLVSGCFLLIRRGLWNSLGGFDQRFFMYAEEADLCYRARRLGARPLFTPNATILHYGGASEVTRASKIEKLFAGRMTFILKHWSGPRQAAARRLMTLHVLTRALGYAMLARLDGVDRHRQSTAEWLQVWRERAKWTSGYASSAPAEANTMTVNPCSTRGSNE